MDRWFWRKAEGRTGWKGKAEEPEEQKKHKKSKQNKTNKTTTKDQNNKKNSQGKRVIERESGNRRGTGAKWKGHTYKVRVQQDTRPHQIASRERKRGREVDMGMGKISELCVERK